MPLPAQLSARLDWLKNQRLAFSPQTAEALAHYVYMLMRPDDGRIFYVGQGIGQRVFDHVISAVQLMVDDRRDHLDADELDEERSEKLGTIADIVDTGQLPLMHIIRDGMATQEEACRVEGALIDVMNYLATLEKVVPSLTNMQAGHGVASFRTVEDAEATHGKAFDLVDIGDLVDGEPVLFLNIFNSWGDVKAGRRTLFAAASGWWRLGMRKNQCRYVVVHAWGTVRGVFPITGWSGPDPDGKVAFLSSLSHGLPGDRLRHRNVPHEFPRGSMNGVKYVTYRAVP